MTDTRLNQFKSNTLGTSITLDDVLENFALLDDWEERYGYIADLGKQLPSMPDADKNEQNLVRGCQSQVWLIDAYDAAENRLYLMIDSDAIIVKGLAAIIMIALNGKTPQQIVDLDVLAIFEQIDLMRHISPTRGNGLRAMLDKVKALARAHL